MGLAGTATPSGKGEHACIRTAAAATRGTAIASGSATGGAATRCAATAADVAAGADDTGTLSDAGADVSSVPAASDTWPTRDGVRRCHRLRHSRDRWSQPLDQALSTHSTSVPTMISERMLTCKAGSIQGGGGAEGGWSGGAPGGG